MQLSAAGCQSKQLTKTLMKDYNNFMNEDKWSNIQNKQQQQKTTVVLRADQTSSK